MSQSSKDFDINQIVHPNETFKFMSTVRIVTVDIDYPCILSGRMLYDDSYSRFGMDDSG